MKSIYIHIPFCNSICSYCDFSKMYYNESLVDKYLISLEKEIKEKYNGEVIKTIYIGGGTPSSLNTKQLINLLEITKIFKTNDLEFTFEVNIESITEEKIKILKQYNINRISIGIETFNPKLLKILNRHHTKSEVIVKVNMIKKYIKNINIDLMYAIESETIEDLVKDLDLFLKLDVNHISTYSLIIEEHTVLYNKNTKPIDEELDYEMYKLICDKLKENNYEHYEISNFAKNNYESKHNLTYWNNEQYYGFGLGAAGYIDNIRYENTRSIKNYLNGNYVLESHKLEKKEMIENEFILGLRKLKGINIKLFKEKYDMDIMSIKNISNLLKTNKLILNDNNLFINPKYLYTSNDILINFIDI